MTHTDVELFEVTEVDSGLYLLGLVIGGLVGLTGVFKLFQLALYHLILYLLEEQCWLCQLVSGLQNVCVAELIPLERVDVEHAAQPLTAERQERFERDGEVGHQLQGDVQDGLHAFGVSLPYFPRFALRDVTVADTDFMVPFAVQEAVNNINKYARFGYTYPGEEYFNSYIYWFSKRYNASFTKEDCIFSTGVVSSIDSILKRVCETNDKVMMFTPIYNVFFNCIKNNGLILEDCPFIYKDYRYEIDWDSFEKKIKDVKAFILCNPHNPIGVIFKKDDIKKISDLCLKNQVYLLSDEIHADIDYNENHYHSSLEDVDNKYLITLLSPGKTFNLAGLHSSIIVIKDKELKEKIERGVYQDDIGEPSIFSINPVIAAYKYGEDYVFQLNEYLKGNRELVKEFVSLEDNKLHLIFNEATYLLWIDISDYHIDVEEFTHTLLEKYKVAVAPGNIYGDSRFIRINIATSRKILKTALERMMTYLKELN